MNVRWIGANDIAWDTLLSRTAASDVFFSSAYHRACEADGRGQAVLVAMEDGDDVLAQPLLLRPIEQVGSKPIASGRFDAESAYGYAGPLASPRVQTAFLERAWQAYAEAVSDHGVVAEFIRLHPYLENVRLLPPAYRAFEVRQSVTLELRGRDAETLWASYPPAQRNMVRRARTAGLSCRVLKLDDGCTMFHQLYEASMHRLTAGPDYFFSCAFFESLGASLDRRAVLIVAEDQSGSVAAAGLFLLGPTTVHYFLAAADPSSRAPGRANIVLHEAALLGLEHGLDALHLGGGRTGDPDDSLLRFKLSVSSQRLPVHVAARVHDVPAYEALCESWLEQAATTERPAFHLLYRLPLPA
ncbi:MAG: GNAT family N-acetyltransferase [Acidimicrobiales bacterium]